MNRYEVIEHSWDGELTYRLLDHAAGAEAEVIPAVGFNLFRYDLRNDSYIAKPEALSVLREQSSRYGVPILFPPGRVRHGAFTFEGRDYQLPINREPHHAHGELRYTPWKVTATTASDDGGAAISAELDIAEHPDLLACFPHAARFRFTYRLQDGGLTLSGEIANLSGMTMPLGLGFHPYFSFAADEAAKVKVVIPAIAEWAVDADFVSAPAAPSPLAAALRDGVYVTELPGYPGDSQVLSIEPGEATYELIYEARKTKLVFDIGDKFPIHVLFTPTWSHSVSLEPLTCIPDGFNAPWPNELTGVQGLLAGDSFSFKWSIRIESLK
jgi:aldose 1-epimerase